MFPSLWSQIVPVFWRARFSIASVMLALLVFAVPSQSLELFHALVEGGHGGHRGRYLLTVFAAASALWALATWYSARLLLSIRFPGEFFEVRGEDPRTRTLATWLPRALGALTWVSAAVGMCFAAAEYGEDATDPRRLLLWLAALWVALGLVFLLVVTVRRRATGWMLRKLPSRVLPRQKARWANALKPVPPVATRAPARIDEPSTWFLLGFALGCFALGMWVGLRPFPATVWIGTLSIFVLALAAWMPLATGVAYLSHRSHLPIATALLILAIIGSYWNDNHTVRSAGPLGTRPPFSDYLASWKQPGPDSEVAGSPVILITAEGGGIRAAYWTAAVLGRFQDEFPAFSRHVLAISSVSGGSLGAATFASLVGRTSPGPGNAGVQASAGRVLGRDFLSPTVGMLLFPDLVQRFIPAPIPAFDRARGMELAWERALQQQGGSTAFSEPATRLWSHGPLGQVPAVLLNATSVEEGRRFIVSPAFQTAHLFEDATDGLASLGADVPLSTAAHLSARFPYISPLGRVEGFGHVADGGYFENSGAATLLDLLNALSDASSNEPIKPLVIVIKYTDGAIPRRSASLVPAGVQGPVTNRFLTELLGPPVALLQAREARASFSVKSLRRKVKVLGGRTVTIALDDKQHPLPLGWTLSETAQKYIDDCVKHVPTDFLVEAGLRRSGPPGGPAAPVTLAKGKVSPLEPLPATGDLCPAP
ncbi:MAG TPA: hypothetical protein VMK42_07660 [Anaeromyxobacteraceae bacterium]|nr:hypothetical protein [Anaeromyxobacteraceae bacterium]